MLSKPLVAFQPLNLPSLNILKTLYWWAFQPPLCFYPLSVLRTFISQGLTVGYAEYLTLGLRRQAGASPHNPHSDSQS